MSFLNPFENKVVNDALASDKPLPGYVRELLEKENEAHAQALREFKGGSK